MTFRIFLFIVYLLIGILSNRRSFLFLPLFIYLFISRMTLQIFILFYGCAFISIIICCSDSFRFGHWKHLQVVSCTLSTCFYHFFISLCSDTRYSEIILYLALAMGSAISLKAFDPFIGTGHSHFYWIVSFLDFCG